MKKEKVVCHDCTWNRKIRREVERHQKWKKTIADCRLNHVIRKEAKKHEQ